MHRPDATRKRAPLANARGPHPPPIEGLGAALERSGEAALPGLEDALAQACAGAPTRLVGCEALNPWVYRLALESAGTARSVVAKRLDPAEGRRSQLVFERWLPAVGLDGGCPTLLGRAADPDGAYVWHVTEDVGDGVLRIDPPRRDQVEKVVGFLARLHARFAGHARLGEVRGLGRELGIGFFTRNVTWARDTLRALSQPGPRLTPEREARCRRLIDRFARLLESVPARADAFRAHAGPDTLLHGDLWAANVVLADGGRRVCLIDWDRAGVGPASYDVSTLLLRIPRAHRAWVLDLYRRALEAGGGRMPEVADANLLFETAELGRIANRLGFVVQALHEGGSEWAWESLGEMERWLESLEPVVPESRGRSAIAAPAAPEPAA